MFKELKEKLNFVEAVEMILDQPLVKCGDVNSEPEDKTCPFCGHKDCFKVNEQEGFYKCFSASCEESGDVITLAQKLKGFDSAGKAARWLAGEFNISLPSSAPNPVQELFDFAASFYHTKLKEAKAVAALRGKTPFEYQTEVRHHTPEILEQMQVGWATGNLVETFISLGFDKEVIQKSNLVNRQGKDFFPNGVFIYPHFVRGRASHFTIKDPLKQKEFQLPHKATLNDYMWYNSDSLSLDGPVIIVEGENDLLSVLEAGWKHPILATIGTLSRTQIESFPVLLKNRDVITIFDNDDAGDGYRKKVQGNSESFKSLKQIKVESVKDIDEYLKAGGDLTNLLSTGETIVETMANVVIKDNSYFKLKMKDDALVEERLTDFLLNLLCVYKKGPLRQRDIQFVRHDGYCSDVVQATSDHKISVKSFSVLAADAADATFYGGERDLKDLWAFIYSQGKEKIVELYDYCGYVPELGGWLMGNMFIPDNDDPVLPISEDGVIWRDDSHGIKLLPLEANSSSSSVPILTPCSKEEADVMLKSFIDNFSHNLNTDGDQFGDAVTIAAYSWAGIYVNEIFKLQQGFPIIHFWGTHGGGKSSIMKWTRSFFGMPTIATAAATNNGSQVGWQRMLAYFSCLPLVIDEVRVMSSNAQDFQASLRNYYDRTSRVVASKDSTTQVISTPVRGNLIIGGEEPLSDPATQQRCIPIFLAPIEHPKRDTGATYSALSSLEKTLSGVGYNWILQRRNLFKEGELAESINQNKKWFQAHNIEARSAVVWSVISTFAEKICNQFYPEFNFKEYALTKAVQEKVDRADNNVVYLYFNAILNSQITKPLEAKGDIVKVVENQLFVTLDQGYNIYLEYVRRNPSLTAMSKRAVHNSLRSSKGFVKYDKKLMTGVQLYVDIFELTEDSPEYLVQVADMCRKST